MQIGNLIRGFFGGKGKPGATPPAQADATPLVLHSLARARTIEPSWTESATALGKYHRARSKRNREANRSRARNRGRHPQSACAA